ncbi:GNAT family N-acetyltransferase [Pseudohoeflea coraliihabitans]|uniref:GNAT family N-acetyltransferase n=1 Tax=Pseudohoeflea coraliihabitans TaxID=2860393 RepID=A0ABS6WNX7_9HYPH|nr:GNAT family N-acetyltransferase [Pseudohoeflea sp. DP4N28-3]MBW3096779.1 GNAT family N-acetyltransferase [Pseudohoeflea sp. DP4N28-3]
MSNDTTIDIGILHLKDAHHLAPLLANYIQSLKRGAPRRPDEYYAETLLQDRAAQIFGARLDGALVGFVVFYDLPDPVTGMRQGQVDHIYVSHEHRGMGIARAMIDMLAEEADTHGWSRLLLNAPRLPEDGRKLYEKIAAAADHTSWQITFDNAPTSRDKP